MDRSRRCDRCGRAYYRSNRLRLWTGQNPGHRAGWQKDDVKLCLRCMNQAASAAAARLAMVKVKIVTVDMQKKEVA